MDQNSKLFETNSIAIGAKELFQRKIYVKKRHFVKILYIEWRLLNHMEIKCIYKMKSLFEDFTEPLAFFCVSKNINWRKHGD